MTDVKTYDQPMTVVGVAEYTGLSETSIREAIKAGGLKGHRPKGLNRTYYMRSDVDAWLRGEEAGDEGLHQGDAR